MLEDCGWDVDQAINDLKEEELGRHDIRRRLQERLARSTVVSGSGLEETPISKEGEEGTFTACEVLKPRKLNIEATTKSNLGPSSGRDAHKENLGDILPAPEKKKRVPTPRALDEIDEGQILKPDKLQTNRVPTPRASSRDEGGQALKRAKSVRYEKILEYI